MSPFFLFPSFSFFPSFFSFLLLFIFFFCLVTHSFKLLIYITQKSFFLLLSTSVVHFHSLLILISFANPYINVPQTCFMPLTLPLSSLHFVTYIASLFFALCHLHFATCCVSLAVFFSFFNVCFLLSTTHVHSPKVCASHNNSSTSCYTWSGFLIFFTHHN